VPSTAGLVCKACGLVHGAVFADMLHVGEAIMKDRVDHANVVRQFTAVRQPAAYIGPVRGSLASYISGDYDWSGRMLDAREQKRYRVLVWTTRMSFTSAERRLFHASRVLGDVAEAIRVIPATRSRAAHAFQTMLRVDPSLDKCQYPHLVAVALYTATKEAQLHVTVRDVVRAMNGTGHPCTMHQFMQCLARCQRLIPVKPAERGVDPFVARVEDRMPAWARGGDTGAQLRAAIKVLEARVPASSKHSPKAGVRAAALIYAAGKMIGNAALTEGMVAAACGASDVSLRRVYHSYYKRAVWALSNSVHSPGQARVRDISMESTSIQ